MAHPHPHTWTTAHLRELEAAAAEIAPADADAFAATLPARFKHVEGATHNRALRRIEVRLHPGDDGSSVGFPVALRVGL